VTRALRQIDPITARRLAVHAQRLDGVAPRSTSANVLDVIRSIRCVQLDPISVVARSPHLVLHSRLGGFRPGHLDRLLWQDRSLFEYWAHAASIVLTEDLPIHAWYMRRFLSADVGWARRHLEWMRTNAKLRRSILGRLRREGPLPSRRLADLAAEPWRSTGWTNERNVDKMLTLLWMLGTILVAARQGQQKLWDLAARVLPPDASRGRLLDLGVTLRAADVSLRGLGVGTLQHIRSHFTRNRYPELTKALAALERSGSLERVAVVRDGERLPGTWFLHTAHVDALDRIEAGDWTPRTTMLSPFDNLIHDRARALALFDLHYRIEIYVPKRERRYGYYSMPVLDGDRFVARIDPAFDRSAGRLTLNAVHAEAASGRSIHAGSAVGRAVDDLAGFLGAEQIRVAGPIPRAWRPSLG
jgi:hypothetical protein